MSAQRRGSAVFSIALVAVLNVQLMAGPGNALILYPVLALSQAGPDRVMGPITDYDVAAFSSTCETAPVAGDVLPDFNGTPAKPVGPNLRSRSGTVLGGISVGPVSRGGLVSGVVSADAGPDMGVGSDLGGTVETGEVSEASVVSRVPGQSESLGFDALDEPSQNAEPDDYEDTLIRSDAEADEKTFAREQDSPYPDAWSTQAPGSAAAGAHPGYRREGSEGLVYDNSGVTYFTPPARRVSGPDAYSYPDPAGVDPAGAYAYRYDGMVPMGDPAYYDSVSYETDVHIPFISRKFRPEDAHLKAGPVYFQALFVEAGVLYSDYHGPKAFRPGDEDGWLSYSSLRFRLAAQISPSLYLTADGEIIYLFGENELGFRSSGLGGPFARLTYERQYGRWDFRAYAEFGTGSFYDQYREEAYERAGRYRFGFTGRNDDDLFSDPYLYTRVGVEASTLTSPDWRLTFVADHTDYWHVGNRDRDDEHWAREHVGVRYAAEPHRVPFTPWFSYDGYSDDYFETMYHRFYVGGSGRLSQNVFFDGRAGYLLVDDDFRDHDRFLWSIGLRHRINERTTHGVRFGQDFFMSEFSIDTVVSNFAQYYVTHRVSDRFRLHGFVQWTEDEYLDGPFVGGTYEREMYGALASYDFTDRLRGSLGYTYETRRRTDRFGEDDRSILEARLDARIGEYTRAYLLYRHEDTDLFYEDLYKAGIRRYF